MLDADLGHSGAVPAVGLACSAACLALAAGPLPEWGHLPTSLGPGLSAGTAGRGDDYSSSFS